MRSWVGIVIWLGLIVGGASGHAAQTHGDRRQIEEATRLQVFLDYSNFGPGKIDGRYGEFTRKAVMFFKRSKGQPDSGTQDSKTSIDTTGLDLAGIDPVFTTYVVNKGDIENVGDVPSSRAAQAKVKSLPYRSVVEAVAEKFHCDVDFLKELNPGIKEELKEGDQVTVPNVQPFELSAVKTMKSNAQMATTTADGIPEKDKPDHPQTAELPTEVAKEEPQPVSLYVSTKENILEVHVGEKLAAIFPVTVGSQHTESPIGRWTVKAIAKLPTFRYDLKMLEEGKRSSDSYLLPPGPNNPSGVIWIALNKDGIGIHGTDDPDSIGRTASHGCIRLANWDVIKLAAMVKPGVSVVVE